VIGGGNSGIFGPVGVAVDPRLDVFSGIPSGDAGMGYFNIHTGANKLHLASGGATAALLNNIDFFPESQRCSDRQDRVHAGRRQRVSA